eukprot:gene14231-20203_t
MADEMKVEAEIGKEEIAVVDSTAVATQEKAAYASASHLSCTDGTKLVVRERKCTAGEEKLAYVMGIDEAGRGPVLGPMVYCGLFAPASEDLSSRSFADSKTLTAHKRDELFDGKNGIESDDKLGYVAEILSAKFITEHMLAREKTSLNIIAMNSTIKIIQTVLDMGVVLSAVYIDTVGDPERYAASLSRRFPTIQFTVCPKADALYACVSGASIVAKVVRDRALEVCKTDLGLSGELGCGYPGDTTTIAFLKTHKDPLFGFPPIVRQSWETCNRLLAEEGGVCISWEADEDQDGGAGSKYGGKGSSSGGAQQQQKLSFGSASSKALEETSAVGRHPYFR